MTIEEILNELIKEAKDNPDWKAIQALKCAKKELKKGQGQIKPWHKCCGNEYSLVEDSTYNFCPFCGKRVNWETISD